MVIRKPEMKLFMAQVWTLNSTIPSLMSVKNTENDEATFYHPYVPYKVQLELMNAIYDAVDKGYKVGLFESPTGTGKTLSLICSTMTWLRKNKATGSKVLKNEDSDDEPEWIKEAYRNKVLVKRDLKLKEYENHLEKLKLEQAQMPLLEVKIHKKPRGHQNSAENDNSRYIPEDYDEALAKPKVADKLRAVNDDVKALMSALDTGRARESEDSDPSNPIKILISSRTHSQLSQFSGQLRITKFPSSIHGSEEHLKCLPLGSRKQLCINKRVSKLTGNDAITESCLDLQKAENGCPHYPKLNDINSDILVKRFRDLTYTKAHDIEDLHDIGASLGICPYYSSRSAVNMAEVITLPYQLLLQESTRDALSLRVKDAIVVIDEAHNLFDTITSMNSCCLSYKNISDAKGCLKLYLGKFQARLNAGNRINLARLLKFLNLLSDFIVRTVKSHKKIPIGLKVTAADIFEGTTGDAINFNSLVRYVSKTKIAYKIDSYLEEVSGSKNTSHQPLLFGVTQFMTSMSNPSKSGKMFFDKTPTGDVCLKYLLLDPSEAMRDLVDQARCVLLAGGTMEPVEEFTDILFPYVPKEKIMKFSCDHIISSDKLSVFPIGSGINGGSLEFSFEKRNSMAGELGETVISLIEHIPGGVVAFFPSYAYLDQIVSQWENSGSLSRITHIKPVVKEESSEDALAKYTALIHKHGGALLLAVVGGRLSEGINFSDNLARGVIMVGLPFPNAFSGELLAKKEFIEQRAVETGKSKFEAAQSARNYYENICMKAVNQSVGRSIRHMGDYACIYLLDQRYGTDRIQGKLSRWICNRLESTKPMDARTAIKGTKDFFSSK
ncbi:unnamed protein product [Kuraishia capsulata CBS 1993]|uniref:ATP-dependent DNA helicase CHL1 n=1 Tax=Kuraishia capsulata CBS 1993 TaxID=1382522 RepID=W6MFH5_9ASCO|nr:uncharacterized protein KUCA_T00000043001 [Kuraishia capsulata CBS 1993]CDK24083.1 unnamed protein product [Kuraishia capsulata CBS 1993]